MWVGASPEALCCVLEQETYPLLSTGSTQEDLFGKAEKIVDLDVKNPIKQILFVIHAVLCLERGIAGYLRFYRRCLS